MPTAILIGFEYKTNSLPGAIIDLYQANKWCQSFGCITHILTDIESIDNTDNLRHAVNRKIADKHLLTFDPKRTIIHDKDDLHVQLLNILRTMSDNRLVIYYSGHGVKECMMLPDGTLLPFVEFRDYVLDNINPYVEIFWILDCCNPNGLYLPYKLEKNKFMLSPSKVQCVLQPILLITSSESNEKSVTTKLGSLFTRNIFRLLTRMNEDSLIKDGILPNYRNRNLRRLMGNLTSSIRKMHTGYAQTVSIYSSYTIDPVLWMWVGSRRSYDIACDMSLTVLLIRPNETISEKSDNPYDDLYPD